MFAEAQAASPRLGRKRLRKEEGKAMERSSAGGGTALDIGGQRVGVRRKGSREGIWSPKSWRLASKARFGGPFPGYLAPRLPPGSAERQPPSPSPTQRSDERASSGAWTDVGRSGSPGKGPVCDSTEGDLYEGGRAGQGGAGPGKGAGEPERTRESRDETVHAAEVGDRLVPGSDVVSALPGPAPGVPGGSGRCRPG